MAENKFEDKNTLDKPYGWYYRLSEFFSKHFSYRIRKIPLDAGLNCPNRDGTKSLQGCTFCYNPSFSPAAGTPERLSISEQIRAAKESMNPRLKEKTRFLAYFQSYTNTYGEFNYLKQIYEEALFDKEVIGLSIATRPDCISTEILELLEYYAQNKHIWLEYGLQSAHDLTLERINRGHTAADFTEAVERTRGRGIYICAHIILGLSGEGKEEMKQTISFLNRAGIDGVKFHHLQIIKNTYMEKQYYRNEIKVFTYDEYLHLLVDLLEILSPDLTIHRLMSEVSDPSLLIAPHWDLNKASLHQDVEKELKRRFSYQGAKSNTSN